MQYFVVDDSDTIVPKSVRPIIDYNETNLGEKKGANRQFRFGNLHIREYDEYYTIHSDKIDPRKDPLGHLLIDAPESLVTILCALYVGKQLVSIIYDDPKNNRRMERSALNNAIISGSVSYITSNIIKRMVKGLRV